MLAKLVSLCAKKIAPLVLIGANKATILLHDACQEPITGLGDVIISNNLIGKAVINYANIVSQNQFTKHITKAAFTSGRLRV